MDREVERKVLDLALKKGFSEAKLINVGDIVVADWVRLKCAYGCMYYRTNLMCPPYTPPPETMRAILKEYGYALLLKIEEANVFDREQNRRMKRMLAEFERELLLLGFYKVFAMGSGPCVMCEECNLKEGKCKQPNLARPAMTALGIDVFGTAKKAGFQIQVVKSVSEKPTYFALVLLE